MLSICPADEEFLLCDSVCSGFFLLNDPLPHYNSMKSMKVLAILPCIMIALLPGTSVCAQTKESRVPERVMERIYEEVKTPYKYGLVMVPEDNSKKVDIRSVFREGDRWYMIYIAFDGRGYETWLAKSNNLLDWQTHGKILSFSDTTDWDSNQKAGDIALQDYTWGGSYSWQPYNDRYWMSYYGGNTRGYEAGLLSISIAYTEKHPAKVPEWQRLGKPVLMSTDKDVRWWENNTMFKSTVIWDKALTTGYPFVMYYNAAGDSVDNPKTRWYERIGMAVSEDMVHWKRYQEDPVLDHHSGITGNAIIQKIDDVWVMFYFGAFWKEREEDDAFNRFACSYDLVNWTDWEGPDLIAPSEPYDETFAHKSFVLKHDGIVYHFYNAVNSKEQRGIALATSRDLGKSKINFIEEDSGKNDSNE